MPPRQRVRESIDFPEGSSRTKQSFAEETNINNIMAKFEKTALLEHVTEHQGEYGNYINVPQDFHAAMNQVMDANQMFMTLPAKLREGFDNDPAKFIDFVENASEDELREADLLPRGGQNVAEATPPGEPNGRRAGDQPEPAENPAV